MNDETQFRRGNWILHIFSSCLRPQVIACFMLLATHCGASCKFSADWPVCHSSLPMRPAYDLICRQRNVGPPMQSTHSEQHARTWTRREHVMRGRRTHSPDNISIQTARCSCQPLFSKALAMPSAARSFPVPCEQLTWTGQRGCMQPRAAHQKYTSMQP